MPPPVPIPSNSTSRLEHVLASFEEASRLRYGRRESSHGSLPLTTAGAGTSGTPPVYSTMNAIPSSYQPRVVRAPASIQDPPASTTRASVSPVRHRSQSSQLLLRPLIPSRTQPISSRGSLPFTPPTYLSNALLSNLFQGGPPPPQAIVPESRQPSEPVVPMSDSDDSSAGPVVSSSRRKQRTQPPRQSISWPSLISIPTQWSESDKSHYLIVSSNGRDVTFNGHPSSLDTRDAAAVRAECPIPAACGVYYYEVKVIDRGNKGQISIGFATKDLQLSKLPGWEPGSWGYHGDDGLSFAGQPRAGSEFGPRFGTGDTIGCGINFLDHNAFYTKNGTWIGTVFSDLPDRDIYPALGLRTSNEHVQANFGGSPFLFDIDAYVAQVKLKAWKDVQNHTLVRSRADSNSADYLLQSVERPIRIHSEDGRSRATREQDESLKGVMADMVLDYLISQGYATTARQFREQLAQRTAHHLATKPTQTASSLSFDHISMDLDPRGETIHPRFDDMNQRTRIMKAIVQGDIETALSLMTSIYPTSLAYDDGIIHFKLRCRRFVELILEAYEAKRRLSKGVEAHSRDGVGMGNVASEGTFAMDLDEDEQSITSPVSAASVTSLWALNGSASTSLQNDWDHDQRQLVKDQLSRTLGLVAYEELYTDTSIQDLVSSEARAQLAHEVNQAILATSMGFAIPLVERMYRHTGTSMEALVAIDIGAGAFLDVSRVLSDIV
ncbi:hypothetical protein FRC15_007787 [Serendipita sp. 397]|nr:hypothetical protein FRC15_007787 [Serendipita sp. 397]